MTFPRNLKLLDIVVGPDWPWLYSFRYRTNFRQHSLRNDFPKKFKASGHRCGTALALTIFISVSDQLSSTESMSRY